MHRITVAALVLALVAGACTNDSEDDDRGGSQTPTEDSSQDVVTAVGEPTDRYDDPSWWVCRGEPTDDVCTSDLDTTVIGEDGTVEVVDRSAAEDPPADCFYVYPTVDLRQEPGNATLEEVGDMELMVRQQAAPFSSVCRVFAPLYEQATIGTYRLMGAEPPDLAGPEMERAYEQVLDAFRWYMANENDGRPIVLLGHSQGSHHVTRLASELFDTTSELADQLVVAAVPGAGFAVNVPQGEVVGGTFENLPLCSGREDTGCVVAYNSFDASAPPVVGRWWLTGGGEGTEAACVDPAELSHGDPTASESVFDYPTMAFGPLAKDISGIGLPEVTTDYLSYPLAYEASCVTDEAGTRLEVGPADPADPRPVIPLDDPTLAQAGLGLHLYDYHLFAGDLLDLTATKIDAASGG